MHALSRTTLRQCATGIAFVLAAQTVSGAHAQDRVVIATTGGTWEQQMREFFFDPFTEETGIEVVTVSGSGSENLSRIVAMSMTGTMEWDLFQAGEIQSSSDQLRSLRQDLSDFCLAYADDDDLLPGACTPDGVLSAYGTTLLAYNADSFPGEGPKNWADFWDFETFPGPRSMPNFSDPWRVLAAALLADGVSPSDLFPLDLDRAFTKMDEIRDHIGLWWRTGDQSTQGFRNGEYVMGQIWQTRAAALKSEDLPLEWSQDQAFLVGDRWIIPQGAPNSDNALKFLEFFLKNVEGQGARCEIATCTPVRYSAAQLMSPEARASVPTSPEVFENLIVPDAEWINANNPEMLDRWNTWILE
jgi:mannopine transport system substrate-binding protein|tara:strand:+ start:20825 stop:21898 length:1074 start_codon:yes stop_codon:yes gene_type:complete